jgi:transposase
MWSGWILPISRRKCAREGLPGMPQTSPRLLLALWLYATSDGVGSAREMERLCAYAPAYRWLCGGITVNHHALSDFRSAEGARIEMLLAQHVASLSAAGLIDLDEIAQDGVKVRANVGAASFRRPRTNLSRPRRCSPASPRMKMTTLAVRAVAARRVRRAPRPIA